MTATTSEADGSPQVIVITGCGALGLACARAVAPEVQLLLSDVSEAQLQRSVVALGRANVVTAACDVSDCGATQRLAATARELGTLRALVHTSGVSGTVSDVETIYAVNLGGALNILDSFADLVSGGTAGVFFASIGGYQLFTHDLDALLVSADPLASLRLMGAFDVTPSAAYGIAKRTVSLHCRLRAKEWGHRGGRLISISPGLIEDTPIGEASVRNGPGRPYAQWSALGRNGRSDEIAAVVRFLISDEASFITGCDVLVDGGLLAGIDHHLPLMERTRWHAAAYGAPSA
jgi:NAD(P)-dependent dehydrogenase (short-subunit alcohol dehydrogenase family)